MSHSSESSAIELLAATFATSTSHSNREEQKTNELKKAAYKRKNLPERDE